jgi:hypothetical protein
VIHEVSAELDVQTHAARERVALIEELARAQEQAAAAVAGESADDSAY